MQITIDIPEELADQDYNVCLGALPDAPDGDAGVEGGFLIVLSSVLAVDSFVSKTPSPRTALSLTEFADHLHYEIFHHKQLAF